MLKNQRRSPRIETELAVDWIRRGVATPITAVNVNRHGMFVLTHEDMPLGGCDFEHCLRMRE